MKRENNLFRTLISDENISIAIDTVNRTHRNSHGRPNKTVIWVESTKQDRIAELQQIIQNGFVPSPVNRKRRYDHSAGKWRDICEPALWPDQYVHHMVVQAMQPVMMRGMDYWCCGSIKGRGAKHGIRGIKKWLRTDRKHTKFTAELDIHHFYDSLSPDAVMSRMNQIIKDRRMLNVLERLIKDGIVIGAYFSQWVANTALQPLDHLIRECLHIRHYVRYMDNMTLFCCNKKTLHKAVHAIARWLESIGLKLKGNWQVYRTRSRMVSAMGYRYGYGRTILRKRNLLRLKRQLARAYKRIDRGKAISVKSAAGLISRIGQLKHCDSRSIERKYIRPGLIKMLKRIMRESAKRRMEMISWKHSINLGA